MKRERRFLRRKTPLRRCKRRFDGPVGAHLKRRRVARTAAENGLYFDCLPTEAVENVLRFTSEKPRRSDWPCFVAPQVVVAMLRAGGCLSACALQTFRAVEAREDTHGERSGVLVRGLGEESRRRFPGLVSALGHSLVELRIDRPTLPKTWNRSLVRYCHNLRHLALFTHYTSRYFSLPDILAAHSGKLEVLELRVPTLGAQEIGAIAAHCTELRRLTLCFERICEKLDPVWETVGGSLAELHLDCGFKRFGEQDKLGFQTLSEFCGNVRRMRFSAFRQEENHSEIEGLCRQYGAQLRSLVLAYTNMGAQSLGRIAAACRNVEIEMRDYQGCDASAMIAMGSRASSMIIGCFTVEHDGAREDLRRVSEACPNLRTIRLEHVSVSDGCFSALFAFPKQKLMQFNADHVGEATMSTVLDVLAERVCTIEIFEYVGLCLPLQPLCRFARANRALRRVQLTTWRPCLCTSSEAAIFFRDHRVPALGLNWPTVVEAFLPCPNLEELDFACTGKKPSRFGEIVDACHPARNRSVSISVCNYQYL